jgi:hypothetical protein
MAWRSGEQGSQGVGKATSWSSRMLWEQDFSAHHPQQSAEAGRGGVDLHRAQGAVQPRDQRGLMQPEGLWNHIEFPGTTKPTGGWSGKGVN